MMSIETLHALQDEAAARARSAGRTPKVIPENFRELDLGNQKGVVAGMPNLGSYRPHGWYLARTVLVEKSGLNGDAGRSIGLNELCEWVVPSEGVAIIEEGQFQFVVGAFRQGRKPRGFEIESGVGTH